MGLKARTARLRSHPATSDIEDVLGLWPEALSALANRILRAPRSWDVSAGVRATASVWQPGAPFLLVRGDVTASGNIVVHTGHHDGGALVVTGDISCRNLAMGKSFTLLCAGSISARECILASATDSVCAVAGAVDAALLDSGRGAWLTLHRPEQLAVRHLTRYVMASGRPLSQVRPNVSELLSEAVIESEEWDSLSSEERAGCDPADYLRVESDRAFAALARGESILRAS